MAGILAWNAREFPAIRVATIPGGPFVAFGVGTSTYEQLDISTDEPTVIRKIRFLGR